MPLMGLVWMTCCLSGLLSYSAGLGNAAIALKNPLSLPALSGLSHRWDLPHRLVRGGNALVEKHRPPLKFKGASSERRLFAHLAQISDRPGKHRLADSRGSQMFTKALHWDKHLQKGQCTVNPPVTNSSPRNALGQQNFLSTPQDLEEKATLISSGPSQKPKKSTPGMGQLLSNFFQEDPLDLESKTSLDSSVQVKTVSVAPGPSRPMTRVNWWHSWHLFGFGQTVSWFSEKNPKQIVFTKPSEFQVLVQGYEVAQLPDRIQADLFAHRIQDWLQQSDRDPAQLTPTTVNGVRAIQGGDRTLLLMSEDVVESIPRNQDLLTVEWTNNLRKALGAQPLPIAEAQAQMYGLVETPQKLQGTASWYGPYFHGRLTANGETYNQEDMTAAHPSLPFDTYLKVKNLQNGKMVIVRINDRGPYIPPRNLDLSLGAARVLGSEETGVISYEATFMKPTAAKGK
ncbi:septal ring lytic transglycosylase RlpA family protein [Laspinema olomoucense]|uniref:septal ring lytic transglycosylase RlpA family protein n=1 Tax=Laspinema olomoucense TaxID=3231600 RepID=UPI00294FFC0E|nr:MULTISPECIES: septal ring lytic transglycosylase RlpA family protein [unclassified Laspinema]